MKSEKLYDAITEVEEPLVEEAAAPLEKKKKKALRLRWVSAVAAVLALALLLTAVLRPGREGSLTAYALESPVYPATAPYPDVSALLSGENVDQSKLEQEYEAWEQARMQRVKAKNSYSAADLRHYLEAAIPAYLAGHEGENAACSPLNLYLALAMLAETTEGESRAQLLSLLGTRDMDSLRSLCENLFAANYVNDGADKSLLAGAIWLREEMDYKTETLQRLAQSYYAASFRGPMGSENYDAQLREWINQQTGNRLTEQTKSLTFDPRTVLALTTTVDFTAHWYSAFEPDRTEDASFHAVNGDLACKMMRLDEEGLYYWGRQFGAVDLQFKENGKMRFLLPDEGVSPEALLRDPEALSFLLGAGYDDWAQKKSLIIHLGLPKFDISSQLSLEQSLKELGITAAFDPETADFSPLTDSEGVFLSQVEHGVRVAVNEEGVTASAVAMLIGAGAAMPPDEEIDFTLDRPFLFAIYGMDNLPLFVGIVNQP